VDDYCYYDHALPLFAVKTPINPTYTWANILIILTNFWPAGAPTHFQGLGELLQHAQGDCE
jgi:hypothetical protein